MLLEQGTSVYVKDRACDISRVPGYKKLDCLCNLGGLAQAAEWNPASILWQCVLSPSDESWTHSIHADTVTPFRLGKRLREMNDPGLRDGLEGSSG